MNKHTASTCGHEYTTEELVNDMGETVTIHHAYPDPDAPTFTYDAYELCEACYTAKMERSLMSPQKMRRAFGGR